MTSPRRQIVDPTAPGYFHCVTRCVRRAFLCGVDRQTGVSFEHRKTWVEERLLDLASCFATAVYAYAVMSNHVHVVVYVDPDAAAAWSADEVGARWTRLFPVRLPDGSIDADTTQRRAQVLAGNPQRVAEIRARLGSLSWFMRCLNEPIARRANREDGCTGRFWEGRFKCQALLDDAAVLACMSYVDLNPVRAGIAADLPSSDHTGVRRRLGRMALQRDTLPALAGSVPQPRFVIGEAEYVALVDWTGRITRPGKRGVIAADAPDALRRLDLDPTRWRTQVLGIESRYWRAVGAVEALLDKARQMGQCWLKGCGARRAVRLAAS